MAKDRNGRQHHLREVTAPATIERLPLETATLEAPIGAQDKDGRWYADTKLCGGIDKLPNGKLPSDH